MAKKTLTILADDIDGTEGAETVHFGIDGTDYAVDLNAANRAKLNAALSDFVKAGRQLTATTSSTDGRRDTASGLSHAELQSVREWASTQGIAVAERGRVARTVIDAYCAAN